jgi:hypothetical protein
MMDVLWTLEMLQEILRIHQIGFLYEGKFFRILIINMMGTYAFGNEKLKMLNLGKKWIYFI